MTANTLIDQFLDHYWLSTGASQNTLSAYRSDLALFDQWLSVSIEKVSVNHIQDYFQHRQLSASTQARILTCLRLFYQYLLRTQLISSNPTEALHHPKQEQKLPVFLNIDEVDRLLNTPDKKTIFGLRDRAMLELLYSCGLRVSELINLNYPNLNLHEE